MAPFNWFRRQFDEQDKNAEPEGTESQSAEAPAQQSSSESTTSQPQQSPEDYLQWAKAAYQNIQKRQQTDATQTTPAAEESAEPAPEATQPSVEPATAPETVTTAAASAETTQQAEPDSEPQAATEDQADTVPVDPASAVEPSEPEAPPEPAITEPEPTVAEADTDEPAIATTEAAEPEVAPPEPETTPLSEPVAAEAEAEPEAQPTAPLPFWAQAEAERQERLERLRATATEEPEPEPQPVRATQTPEPVLDNPLLDFDEGFLWSAEVLAAQGRRPDQISLEEITWLKRLRQGLDKTRRSLVNQLKSIVGQGPLNQEAVMEIETLLLQADVGIEATDHIIESLQNRLRQEALPPEQAIAYLKSLLREMLDKPLGGQYNATFAPEKGTFNIWLMTGVNGAGKTTTIGKIAHLATKSDYRCLIAAADTFRAAAVQQVRVWGDRSNVEVIANPGQNTDPAAVVFDAIAAAKSRDAELLLVDTAGRLQNKKNLMEELGKIRRIIDKKAPDANVESLLVLDATLGQNGLRQAEVFSEVAQLSGVVLTKLDGTAKGGIALAVVQQLGLPIRFIGAGEGIEDLRPFSSYEFVEALLSG
jgi:fused signal recognition particle receptor